MGLGSCLLAWDKRKWGCWEVFFGFFQQRYAVGCCGVARSGLSLH